MRNEHMLVSFVKNVPALFIRKEKILVVGDLHIGLNLRYRSEGIHFQEATRRMADSLLSAYRKSGARCIVLLGDVKDSIGSPGFAEYRELKTFFDGMVTNAHLRAFLSLRMLRVPRQK